MDKMEIDDEEITSDQAQVLQDRISNNVDADFYQLFRKLPTKTAVTIRLFERGDYYTCHGDDALFIARELLQSTNALKYWKTSGRDCRTRGRERGESKVDCRCE